MCGIAGFCLNPETAHELDAAAISKLLLLGILPRGHDAAGAAWWSRSNRVAIQKAPLPANKFLPYLNMSARTTTAVLHTRFATTGSPENNKNNHPVVAPGIENMRVIGTHNGWVTNCNALTERHKLDLDAEVDSQVLFALAYKYGGYKWMEKVYGNVAGAYLREDKPNELFLFRGRSSPLILMHTVYGTFYASAESALEGIFQLVGGPAVGFTEVFEGRYVHLKNGVVTSNGSFAYDDSSWYGTRTTRYDLDDEAWGRGADGVWRRGSSTYPGTSSLREFGRQGGENVRYLNYTGVTGWRTDSSFSSADPKLADVADGTTVMVRTYFGAANEMIRKLIDIKPGIDATPVDGAYGRWIPVRNYAVDFQPWVDGDSAALAEAARDDILFNRALLKRTSQAVPEGLAQELAALHRLAPGDETLDNAERRAEEAFDETGPDDCGLTDEDQGTTPRMSDDEFVAATSIARAIGHGEGRLLGDGTDVAVVTDENGESRVWLMSNDGNWRNTGLTEEQYEGAQEAMAEDDTVELPARELVVVRGGHE